MQLELLLVFITSAITCLVLTPWIITKANALGYTGIDVNKREKTRVANYGGFAITAAITSASLIGVLLLTLLTKDAKNSILILAALASILIVSLIGIVDDLFKLRSKSKILLPIIGALPLIAIKAGETIINLPLLGPINLGYIYTFALIPLGITGSANAINMTAGYNGLEAGITAIITTTLLIIAIATNTTAAAIILTATLAACLAFLKFNWKPAKIFPADIGTYALGTAIAAAAIIGNMEKYAVIAILPCFYELLATTYYEFKGIKRREICHTPIITNDNKINVPKGAEHYTLAFLIISTLGPQKENQLVKKILILFLISSITTLVLFNYKI